MLEVAVCDDQKMFCDTLRKMLSDCLERRKEEYHIDTFLSGEEFLNLQGKVTGYDVIYLDIDMEGMNGIQVARKLRQWHPDILIIFVTAFVDFSTVGYQVEALRYILKDHQNMSEGIEESVDAVLAKRRNCVVRKEFCFREGNREIPLEKLELVESMSHELQFTVYHRSEKIIYTMRGSLRDVPLSVEEGFVRTHQSYLVNLRYVKEISSGQAVLWDGKIIPVSRANYREVNRQFILYKGEF